MYLYKINKYFELWNSTLIFFKFKKIDIIDETFKEINKQLKQLKSFNTFDYIKELETQLNDLNEQKNIIDYSDILNIINDENLINEYLEKSKLFEEENKTFKEIKAIENLKLEISNKLKIVLELKDKVEKYNSYFSFLDFIKMIKNDINKKYFIPYKICLSLLEDEINKPVDFFKSYKDNFLLEDDKDEVNKW